MDSPRPHTSDSAAPRRSFTAPVPPLAPQPAASPQSTGGLVDTLYDHPNVKIVSFTAGASSLQPAPQPGSLPWSSQLERTIAVGPFRIYRAPGSVAFLNCGSALQPILPKSQAWCVDEESSKFVLQIRRPQYWRIEVPVDHEENVRRAQHLRQVFDAILQFEKTECPFQRSFTVELPERPPTPLRKRPWTPVRRSSASLPLTPVTPVEIARLHEGTPRGSICVGDLRTAGAARRALSEHLTKREPRPEESVSTDRENLGSVAEARDDLAPAPSAPLHLDSHPANSNASAEQVPLLAIPSPKPKGAPNRPANASKSNPPTESLESLHGRESWLSTPLPPSPPLSTPGSPRSPSSRPQALDETSHDHPGMSEEPATSVPTQRPAGDSLPGSESSAMTTIPPSRDPARPAASEPSAQLVVADAAPAPADDGPETPFKTPSSSPSHSPSSPSPSAPSAPAGARRPPIRRATTSSSISPSRRALSPFPPAADLFTPHLRRRRPSSQNLAATSTIIPVNPSSLSPSQAAPSPLSAPSMSASPSTPTPSNLAAAVRRLPMTVLHKTREILMSPPSHLLHLMLSVAARIAAGEWRGLVFGTGEQGERVSVRWDWSDDGEEEEDDHDDHEGVLYNRRRRQLQRRRFGGWDEGWYAGHGRFGGDQGDDGTARAVVRWGWNKGRSRLDRHGDIDVDGDGEWSVMWGGGQGKGQRMENGKGKGRVKMAGSFPESSDDDDDDDDDRGGNHSRGDYSKEEEAKQQAGEEGEVDPLDTLPSQAWDTGRKEPGSSSSSPERQDEIKGDGFDTISTSGKEPDPSPGSGLEAATISTTTETPPVSTDTAAGGGQLGGAHEGADPDTVWGVD